MPIPASHTLYIQANQIFQSRLIDFIGRCFTRSAPRETRDSLAQYLLQLLDLDSFELLIESITVTLAASNRLSDAQKIPFMKGYIDSFIASSPDLRRFLSENVRIVKDRGTVSPYVFSPEKLQAAKANFVSMLNECADVNVHRYFQPVNITGKRGSEVVEEDVSRLNKSMKHLDM